MNKLESAPIKEFRMELLHMLRKEIFYNILFPFTIIEYKKIWLCPTNSLTKPLNFLLPINYRSWGDSCEWFNKIKWAPKWTFYGSWDFRHHYSLIAKGIYCRYLQLFDSWFTSVGLRQIALLFPLIQHLFFWKTDVHKSIWLMCLILQLLQDKSAAH